MGSLPAKVAARIAAGLKKYQPIIQSQKARDINESDTVVVVADVLQDVFGYDKFKEITTEHAIRGTFCDLAIKIDEKLRLLIEIKAIGTELKDQHVKQAVDYAANEGCDWVVLTNSICWRVYKVIFDKPIDKELVVDIDFLALDAKADEDIEIAGLIAREAWQKERLGEYLEQKQAVSRFTIAAVLLSEPLLGMIRRELRRVSPSVRIEIDEIANALRADVIKRDALEGDKAEAACKLVAKAARKILREAKSEPKPAPTAPAVEKA
jgi:predicted type IV restriction endonuclease